MSIGEVYTARRRDNWLSVVKHNEGEEEVAMRNREITRSIDQGGTCRVERFDEISQGISSLLVSGTFEKEPVVSANTKAI